MRGTFSRIDRVKAGQRIKRMIKCRHSPLLRFVSSLSPIIAGQFSFAYVLLLSFALYIFHSSVPVLVRRFE